MGKPYSSDLRQRFVAALDEGMSTSAAGRRMRIARSTAVRWAATWQREGRAGALPMGGDRRSEALEAHATKVLGRLEEKPDLYLSEIVARLTEESVESSVSSVVRLLTRHGVTRKKGCGRCGTGARGYRPCPRRMAGRDERSGPVKARLH